MKRYAIVCLVFLTLQSFGQCLQEVNFNDWQVLGNPNAEWFVLNDSTVREYGDAQPPTFFVSPYNLINVRITGKMRVDWHNDEDFVGLVFGYQAPEMGTPDNQYHFILFDWKKATETFQGINAFEGMTLSRVNMEMTYNQTWLYFWGHFEHATGFQVLARKYNSVAGWDYNTEYDYELIYTATRIIISINGTEIFNVEGCFEPGRFGFYSYSQQNSVFSNFNYGLKIDFIADRQNICEGETIQFTVTDPDCSVIPANIDSYQWDFGDGTNSQDMNTSHTFITAGTYEVKLYVTDDEGCQDSSKTIVRVHAYPEVNLGADTLVEYGASVSLDAGNPGAAFEWSTGADSPSIVLEGLKQDTLVRVIVSRNGCFAEDEILISVEPPPVSRVFVPNAFTPNGDGRNDHFYPTLVNVERSEFMIFDRWGRQLFHSKDNGFKWEGKCGNDPCPDGVYVWKLIYDAFLEDESTEQKVVTGTVVLIK